MWRKMLFALAALVSAAVVVEHVSARLDAKRFPAPGRLVAVDSDGRRMHIRCVGAGSPIVVFEAGGTHDSMQYLALQDELASETRVCAYDRAGMGWSDPRSGPLDARALADELVASLGRFAAPLERRASLARVLAHLGVLRFFDPHGFASLPPAEHEAAVARAYHHAPWDAVCSLLTSRERSVAELRAAPPLPADIPRIVIVHDHGGLTGDAKNDAALDPLWRAEQSRFASASMHGRLVVAERSGHHLEEDRPDVVLAAIREMLRAAHPD